MFGGGAAVSDFIMDYSIDEFTSKPAIRREGLVGGGVSLGA